MTLDIVSLRNGLPETRHAVSAALVEGDAVRWTVGDDVASFWRSAAKPFQLVTSLEALAPALVAGLSDRELAIGAASHSGQPAHVALVTALLARFGLDVAGLQCGAHPPAHEASAKLVPAPTALHNNCSGKHAFMLAACAAQGWPRDYRPVDHPLQVKNRARLDALAGVAHGTAIDGCSVPTFHAPVSAQARAWAAVAAAMADAPASLLGRVGWAMQREPFFTSGDERLDLAVVQGASEPLAVKVGAEGLFCIARPRTKQGLAVKVHSGNADVLAVAVRAVLAELGVTVAGPWPWATVKNVRQVEVGERVARWGQPTTAAG